MPMGQATISRLHQAIVQLETENAKLLDELRDQQSIYTQRVKKYQTLESENTKLQGRLESHGCLGEMCGCRNDLPKTPSSEEEK